MDGTGAAARRVTIEDEPGEARLSVVSDQPAHGKGGARLDTEPATAAGTAVAGIPPTPWFHSLDEAWQAMAPPPGKPVPAVRTVSSAGLATAAAIVVEALYQRGPGGQRQVPSAGAVFPYVTTVLAHEQPPGAPARWSLHHVASDARISEIPLPASLAGELARCVDPRTDTRLAHILLLTRPWLSIRKYGPRGYYYAHLDAAHAATNLLGLALGRGRAHLALAVAGEAVDRVLAAGLPFHELIGVISVDPVEPAPVAMPAETDRPGRAAGAQHGLEQLCWSLLGDGIRRSPWRPRPVRAGPVLGTPSRTALAAVTTDEWGALSRRRRSARRFERAPVSLGRVTETLSALATPLPLDLPGPDAPSVTATVVLTPAVADRNAAAPLHEYARVVFADEGVDDSAVVAACQGQAHLGAAQAFVLLHCQRAALLDVGRRLFDDAVFRAGAAGQLLYLGATRAGIAVTAVGGFDPARWSTIAALPQDHEILYLLALGSGPPDTGGPEPAKRDRHEPAHSHGER
ncbi:MAG: nitroreductase family protein [Blastococcus sp.]